MIMFKNIAVSIYKSNIARVIVFGVVCFALGMWASGG